MKELQVFKNPAFGQVRTVVLDDEPFFVGKDVAEILGYSNTNKAIQVHVDSEDKFLRSERGTEMGKLFSSLKEMNEYLGRQDSWLINESGLYSLILSSKLPTAKAFKHWVTSEVLPSIRKTGSYSIPKVTPNPKYRTRMISTAMRDIVGTASVMEDAFGCKKGIALATAMTMIGQAYGFDPSPLRPLLPAEENPATLNTTDVAAKLGIFYKNGEPDPRTTNKLMASAGLIEKSGKGWKLTEEGRAYGEAMSYNRNGHSGYQILWQEDVVDCLKQFIEDEQPDEPAKVISLDEARSLKEDA